MDGGSNSRAAAAAATRTLFCFVLFSSANAFRRSFLGQGFPRVWGRGGAQPWKYSSPAWSLQDLQTGLQHRVNAFTAHHHFRAVSSFHGDVKCLSTGDVTATGIVNGLVSSSASIVTNRDREISQPGEWYATWIVCESGGRACGYTMSECSVVCRVGPLHFSRTTCKPRTHTHAWPGTHPFSLKGPWTSR